MKIINYQKKFVTCWWNGKLRWSAGWSASVLFCQKCITRMTRVSI